MFLRPVQFVDTPVDHSGGSVARIAGGMQWFAAYEVIEPGGRETVRVADVASLGERGAALHAAVTAPRPPLSLGTRTLRFDQPLVAGILNVTPDSFSDGGAAVTAPRPPLSLGTRTLRFDQPLVAGILNVTPDSFSDGGEHTDDPVAAGVAMTAAGAALVDVGGESTRPGAALVWEEDEANRIVPAIERIAAAGSLVSVDTRKAVVMERALAAGAAIVNDVSALLWDERALEVVVSSRAPVILMHSPDPRSGPHGTDAYRDVLHDVLAWLEARVAAVAAAGVDRGRILVDPGIGFGKSLADNLALLNGLAAFHSLGCPVMLGASRKRLIGALSNEAPADQRLGGSLALALKGAEAGVQLLRVHDVAETVQALKVWRGLRDRAFVG